MAKIPIEERKIEPVEVFDVESYGGVRTLAWPTSEMYYDILNEADAHQYAHPHTLKPLHSLKPLHPQTRTP